MNAGTEPGATPARLIDAHQHLWPEPLLAALARRTRTPRLQRRPGGGWDLHMDGEPVWPVAPADHDPVARAALVGADGLDLAVVAPSTPLGVEALPADQAHALVAAYNEGVAALPAGLAAWAAAALDEPDPGALGAVLDRGAVGLCLPAAALAQPAGVERVAPLLAEADRRGRAVFVHPGPAPWAPSPSAPAAAPSWWAAMTVYVAQMQEAWLGTLAWVRPAFPALRISFAMLAGLAPLHRERLAHRGGPGDPATDPGLFYDTSSYGPAAIAAMAAVVGPGALVFGSDRPVVPPRGGNAGPLDPVRGANARRLLGVPTRPR